MALFDFQDSATSALYTGDTSPLITGFLLILLIILAVYVYFALAYYYTARKTEINDEWAGLAWLPFAWPYLMARMAKKHWWPAIVFGFLGFIIAMFFIPLGIDIFVVLYYILIIALVVFIIYWTWIICETRKKSAWWSLITPITLIISIILGNFSDLASRILLAIGIVWEFILWGILGWSK